MPVEYTELERIVKAKLEEKNYKVSSEVRIYKDFSARVLATKDNKNYLIEIKSTKSGIISTLSYANYLRMLPKVDFVYIAAPKELLSEELYEASSDVGLGLIGVADSDLEWDLVKPRELGPATLFSGGGYPSFVTPGEVFDFHVDARNPTERLVQKIEIMYFSGGPFEVPIGERNQKSIEELKPFEGTRVDFKAKVRPDTKLGKYYLFTKTSAEGIKSKIDRFEIEVRREDEEKLRQAVRQTVAELNSAITTNLEKTLLQIDEAIMKGFIDVKENVRDKSVWNDIGMFCIDNGLYRQAELVYSKMLDTIKKYEDRKKERLHKGLALHNLGVALYYQGRRKEAKQRFIEAHEEDRRTFGPEDAKNMQAQKALTQLFESSPD